MCELVAEDNSTNKLLTMFATLTLSEAVRAATYEFTDMWGTQLTTGYSPNQPARLDSGNSALGLTTVDVEAAFQHHENQGTGARANRTN